MRCATAIMTLALGVAFHGCATNSTTERPVVAQPDLSDAQRAALADELLAMVEVDQSFRKADPTSMTHDERQQWFVEVTAVDRKHTARLKEIVEAHGWPTIDMVGKEASDAAFLLVQHADHDPEFQARMLPILEAGAQRGEVSKHAVAYLTDRVRVKQRRPQVYGTQYHSKNLPDGSAATDDDGNLIYLLPVVENVAELDERREAMGLGPWFEYEQRMAEMQNRHPAAQPIEWDGELPVDPQAGSPP